MPLDTDITKVILDFVIIKPRTIQEISEHINKNWRTTERYVEKIEKETGSISTRIFRKGTRGALKIVFWNSVENIHSTSFQSELFEKLMHVTSQKDFSSFDIGELTGTTYIAKCFGKSKSYYAIELCEEKIKLGKKYAKDNGVKINSLVGATIIIGIIVVAYMLAPDLFGKLLHKGAENTAQVGAIITENVTRVG